MESINSVLKKIKILKNKNQDLMSIFTVKQKQNIKKIKIIKGVMYVYLNTSAEVCEFNFNKKEILFCLQKKDNSIKDVYFKVGQ